jgi:hypothetical protein
MSGIVHSFGGLVDAMGISCFSDHLVRAAVYGRRSDKDLS